jgi:hypothetical protein
MVEPASNWVGSVWSHRNGRVVIGRLRAVQGNTATLVVVGLGPDVPEGARVLPPDEGGSPIVQIPVHLLVGQWKRMA